MVRAGDWPGSGTRRRQTWWRDWDSGAVAGGCARLQVAARARR
jgi:hypothetical protein